MAEKIKRSNIEDRLSALEEKLGKSATSDEMKAVLKELAEVKKGQEELAGRTVDVREARQIYEAEKATFECPKCHKPLDEDETPCPSCGEFIKWEEE